MQDLAKIRTAMRIVAAASSIVVALGATSAMAANNVNFDTTGDNSTTGALSSNQNLDTLHLSDDSLVTNHGNATTTGTVHSNTGYNRVKRNTEVVGGASTGMANFNGSVANDINSGAALGWGGLSDVNVSGMGGNHITGAESLNKNVTDVNIRSNNRVSNTGTANTRLNVNSNTGDNETNENTQVNGGSRTGDVNVDANVSNSINAGAASTQLGGGSVSVTGDGSNSVTGFRSDNENTARVNVSQNNTMTNTGTANTTFTVDSNTGKNKSNRNTQLGGDSTGDINASFTVDNVIN